MTGASAHGWASQGLPYGQLMPKPFAVAQVVTAVTQLINAATNSFLGEAHREILELGLQ
jgi:hypothetical protein